MEDTPGWPVHLPIFNISEKREREREQEVSPLALLGPFLAPSSVDRTGKKDMEPKLTERERETWGKPIFP